MKVETPVAPQAVNLGKEPEMPGMAQQPVNQGYYSPVEPMQQQPVMPTPVAGPQATGDPVVLPEEYKPLSMWAFWGLTLLYSIPCIGFIMAIIFSFAPKNISMKNYSRSVLITVVFTVLVSAIVILISAATGAAFVGTLMEMLKYGF